MFKHSEIGTNGELLAVNFLKNKGFAILETNWRSGRREIDIIAENEDSIVFVEVKTRISKRFGYPEEAVTPQKKNLLKTAAADYFEQKNCTKLIRFDIIGILHQGRQQPDIIHIEDAFF